MKTFFLLFSIFTIIGCNQTTKIAEEKIPVEKNNGIGDGAVSPAVAFAQNIENNHQKEKFMEKEAVSFDINLKFGGQTRLQGKISMLTNSSKVRLDKKDGSSLIYDGSQLFIKPDTTKSQGARFDIFTWQYFFAMPYKLTDPGTIWNMEDPAQFKAQEMETAKLSFEENTGDSPDDWYLVYQNPDTKLLQAASYIVTFGGTSVEKAQEEPHAIVYNNYKNVEGIPFATNWVFYNWNKKDGFGDQLGEASISNIEFFKADEDYFAKPEHSRLVKE
mgnify:CR=1 FL=1